MTVLDFASRWKILQNCLTIHLSSTMVYFGGIGYMATGDGLGSI